MLFSEDMRELVTLFQKHEVAFAVCGGFAVAHYGFIRMTMDFDLLILPEEHNARKILSALDEFGFGNVGFSIDSFLSPGSVITLGEQPNQIDLLTSMSSQSTADILRHSKYVDVEGIRMKVVNYKDLIRAKREAGRAKDRIDAEELERLHRK